MQLNGKHVVVTGASSGLGHAMAQALLAAGAAVAAASRPGPRLTRAVEIWQEAGYEATALPVDVRDPQSVDMARDWVAEHWTRCDLLVNNAGIGMRTVNRRFMSDPEPFFRVAPEQFDDVIRTNLFGYFLMARAFTEIFVRQGSGRIVNITMNHTTMVRRGFVPYGPSRAGAESLSRIMTEDLRPYNIAVNLLYPGGATATGMIPEDAPASLKSQLLPPEIMGPPIVYLASDDAQGLSGERIDASHWETWRDPRAPTT